MPSLQSVGTRTTCPDGHDLTLPGGTRVKSKGDGRYLRVCAACDRMTRFQQRQQAAKRAAATRARRKEAEALAAREVARMTGEPAPVDPPVAPEEDEDEERLGPNAKHSPYILTRRLLEQQWGVPIAQWTRAQHQQHNIAMYRMLGWPDEGPARSGVNHLPPSARSA